MKSIFLCAGLALSLNGCAAIPALLGAAARPPPQAPAAVTNISRSALDFALHSFDAALYGFDFAMDLGKPAPGSPEARSIAAAGRKVMSFLGAAEAARDLGNSETYEEAFRKAGEALKEFRAGLGMAPQPASIQTLTGERPPLTPQQREAILARAERAQTI